MKGSIAVRVDRGASDEAREYRSLALPVSIGRFGDNDVAIGSKYVSGRHARIELLRGELSIRDLGSTNGTYVERSGARRRIDAPYPLEDCDGVFFLGDRYRVQVEQLASGPGPENASRPVSEPPRALHEDASDLDSLPSLPSLFHDEGELPPPALPAAGASSPPRAADRLEALDDGRELSLDALALQGLRELARSLSPGARLSTRGDVARLVTRLHDTVEATSRGYAALFEGYRRFATELGLEPSAPCEGLCASASDPREIARALLGLSRGDPVTPSDLAEGFDQLAVHQVALLEGVARGARSLLEELSPESVERASSRSGATFRRRLGPRRLWQLYCERHATLRRNAEGLSQVLGREFTRAYAAYARRASRRPAR